MISLYQIFIVLCLILDSRQNQGEAIVPKQKLYCALFWIQGKTDDADPTEIL